MSYFWLDLRSERVHVNTAVDAGGAVVGVSDGTASAWIPALEFALRTNTKAVRTGSGEAHSSKQQQGFHCGFHGRFWQRAPDLLGKCGTSCN
jgi:hypothetical protein